MKILLIAYEFPPILAAQALRWFYLSHELSKLGVEVEVVCPDISPVNTFPMEVDDRIRLHRAWPGPFIGLSQVVAKKIDDGTEVFTDPALRHGPSAAIRCYRWIRSVLDTLVYPDTRSEWYPFALSKVRSLIKDNHFDVVISSHEPAVDIFIGKYAKQLGIPWIIDMGDPLLTPYSPRWRRGLDLRVERKVIREADHIWVTATSVLDLLRLRHGNDVGEKISIIPQGFPKYELERCVKKKSSKFHMVFTGNFYKDFRNPEKLASALKRIVDVDFLFTIVGDNYSFAPLFQGMDNVRILGKKDHFFCLNMQRESDILINIGNVQSFQVPGKIFEYLGAERPILHIRMSDNQDIGADIIEESCAGFSINNDVDLIEQAIRDLYQKWKDDSLDSFIIRNEEVIKKHSWKSRAELCLLSLQKVAGK
ncbi:glycosyltransferase [Delftia acidovorans]|uniref:glycosyltransferase n=1 Tax=Delftia acidovorans TaxID=80866 RepID=UPI0018E8D783|nr:glycosyltransferase [Delftia acidovorans]